MLPIHAIFAYMKIIFPNTHVIYSENQTWLVTKIKIIMIIMLKRLYASLTGVETEKMKSSPNFKGESQSRETPLTSPPPRGGEGNLNRPAAAAPYLPRSPGRYQKHSHITTSMMSGGDFAMWLLTRCIEG